MLPLGIPPCFHFMSWWDFPVNGLFQIQIKRLNSYKPQCYEARANHLPGRVSV